MAIFLNDLDEQWGCRSCFDGDFFSQLQVERIELLRIADNTRPQIESPKLVLKAACTDASGNQGKAKHVLKDTNDD